VKIREPRPSSTPGATADDDLFARMLAHVRRRTSAALRAPTLAAGLALTTPALIGCNLDLPTLGVEQQADWAHYEGQRRTDMVSYTGHDWSACRNPNSRFGCGSYDMFVALRVKPVAGADLAWKRVGVVYRTPYDQTERTALGYYVGTHPDGHEEWHVAVNVPTFQDVLIFNAWYQDGAANTYYDDNEGEFHVSARSPHMVARLEPWSSSVVVRDSGVHGSLSLQLTDLDYDKEIKLIATTDDWATVIELEMGVPGDLNAWYWAEDYWGGRERWQIDLALPGDFARFRYAVVYAHGVVNGARRYEFWDNNWGADYLVERLPTID
jgi:hypothetical protein